MIDFGATGDFAGEGLGAGFGGGACSCSTVSGGGALNGTGFGNDGPTSQSINGTGFGNDGPTSTTPGCRLGNGTGPGLNDLPSIGGGSPTGRGRAGFGSTVGGGGDFGGGGACLN